MASPVAAGTWEALLPVYFPADLGLVLKRALFRSKDRAFAEGSVTRIDVVDSIRNGTLIGATVVGVPVSMRIGHVLDRAINKPIFRRSSASRQEALRQGHPLW